MLSQLDLGLGAILMGVLLSTVLYGAVTVQTYNYYAFSSTKQRDSLWIRLLVLWVWFVETLHTAFVWAYIYILAITNYNNPDGLLKGGWSLGLSVCCHGMLSFSVQWFFCYRVYVMSGNWLAAIPGALLSGLRWVLELYITHIAIVTPTVTVFAQKYKWLTLLAVGASLAADIWITTALIYNMRKRRSEFSYTARIVDQLIRWTIETGVVTSITAAIILIFVTTHPENELWLATIIIYAKIYSNALMVSLNSRRTIREQSVSNHAHLSSVPAHAHNVLSIRVDQTIHRNDDYELGELQQHETSNSHDGKPSVDKF